MNFLFPHTLHPPPGSKAFFPSVFGVARRFSLLSSLLLTFLIFPEPIDTLSSEVLAMTLQGSDELFFSSHSLFVLVGFGRQEGVCTPGNANPFLTPPLKLGPLFAPHPPPPGPLYFPYLSSSFLLSISLPLPKDGSPIRCCVDKDFSVAYRKPQLSPPRLP